jgi:hypothetical protein
MSLHIIRSGLWSFPQDLANMMTGVAGRGWDVVGWGWGVLRSEVSIATALLMIVLAVLLIPILHDLAALGLERLAYKYRVCTRRYHISRRRHRARRRRNSSFPSRASKEVFILLRESNSWLRRFDGPHTRTHLSDSRCSQPAQARSDAPRPFENVNSHHSRYLKADCLQSEHSHSPRQ